MWLNICMIATKKFFRSFYCKIFNNINAFATAIISFSRIAFCIFICSYIAYASANARTSLSISAGSIVRL